MKSLTHLCTSFCSIRLCIGIIRSLRSPRLISKRAFQLIRRAFDIPRINPQRLTQLTHRACKLANNQRPSTVVPANYVLFRNQI